jgi:hypothetical protein
MAGVRENFPFRRVIASAHGEFSNLPQEQND